MGLNRRGPQKYIPYRADDLEHGKRTGLAVGIVERDSDGFEPFEKLMGQADLRTPPKAKVQRKKRLPKAKTPVAQEEEYEEEDMELDSEYTDKKNMSRMKTLVHIQALQTAPQPISHTPAWQTLHLVSSE